MGTIKIIEYVFYFLFIAIFLGVIVFMFNTVDAGLDIDVDVGQVNLAEVNNATFGRINDALTDNADTLGVMLLLSMCVLMLLNAYFFGAKHKLFMIIDFFILVFAFIISVYLSQTYSYIINAGTNLSTIYINTIPKTSKFLLNLPTLTGTIGALMMIVSYAGLKKRQQGDVNVLGY